MSAPEVQGELFAADASRGRPATLRAAPALAVVCEGHTLPLDTNRLDVGQRLSGVARRLTLADGTVFVTADDDGLEALLSAAGVRVGGRRIAVLEAMRPRLLALVTLAVVAILVSMRWGLPIAADAAATLVPHSIEVAMGANSLDILDAVALRPSLLHAERAAETQVMFTELRRAAGARPDLRLEHRKGFLIGANALALPGGPIIVTDELIYLAPSEDALAGVLAHEIAHVEEHHGLRRLMRAVGMALIITVAIGDSGELVEEAAGLPALLMDRAYSRTFEAEADDGAIAIMRKAGRDPSALADMLAALDPGGAEDSEGGENWLASHPATADRIARLRAEGKQ